MGRTVNSLGVAGMGKSEASQVERRNASVIADILSYTVLYERVVCEDQACVEDLVPAADVWHHRHAWPCTLAYLCAVGAWCQHVVVTGGTTDCCELQ